MRSSSSSSLWQKSEMFHIFEELNNTQNDFFILGQVSSNLSFWSIREITFFNKATELTMKLIFHSWT